jgi:hypothetical protein
MNLLIVSFKGYKLVLYKKVAPLFQRAYDLTRYMQAYKCISINIIIRKSRKLYQMQLSSFKVYNTILLMLVQMADSWRI